MHLVDADVCPRPAAAAARLGPDCGSVDPGTIYLSVITLGEIMKGIALKLRMMPLPPHD